MSLLSLKKTPKDTCTLLRLQKPASVSIPYKNSSIVRISRAYCTNACPSVNEQIPDLIKLNKTHAMTDYRLSC